METIGKHLVTVRRHDGKSSTYYISFKNENHFDNWYNKISQFGKLDGIEKI